MATHYYLVGTTRLSGGAGLTYHCAEELAVGQLVEVTIRNHREAGIILEKVAKPRFATKPITKSLDLAPLPQPLIDLAHWLSAYYAAPPSSAWQSLIPAGVLKARRTREVKARRTQLVPAATLNQEQTAAVTAIESSAQTTTLLRGVTGSGKTEVYQELVRRHLQQGQSAIILIPEIALTPQTEARFRAQFGDAVIITNSRLTEASRYAIWFQALTATEPKVVIGPRSALFLPLKCLGIIVIDESHEPSYKQEQAPRFEATAAAAKLARLHGAKLVLGSATPSVSEAYLAIRGVIGRVELQQQYNQIVAAAPIIVDLANAAEFKANPIFSRTLLEKLTETYDRRRQSLLFLNRRGSASSQICTTCQHVTLCPNCQLPLTLHADTARMVCHICNFHQIPPAVCVNCGHATLKFLGIGTKRVENELQRLFPKARIARLDKDTLASDSLEDLYQALAAREIDFLIGTQMVAKGLDLPQMETIGVVLADSSLYMPDFSATERTYSLLTQVSGRAGRGEHAGRSIIQTYSPNHPVIKALTNGDFWDFANTELAERQLLRYPPFVYLLKLSYSHAKDESAEAAAVALAKHLTHSPDIEVIGPAPAFRRYASGSSHWQIIIKARRRKQLQEIALDTPAGWTSDLDPINLL